MLQLLLNLSIHRNKKCMTRTDINELKNIILKIIINKMKCIDEFSDVTHRLARTLRYFTFDNLISL